MLQLHNGQEQPITAEDRKALPLGHRARFTGEIILRTRPKTYRKVIDLLAKGESEAYIAANCKVSRSSVHAIADRQAATIEQRKNELVMMLSDVAHIGTGRVMDKIGKAATRDAIIGTGVAIDKIVALTQGTVPQVGVVIMPSDSDRQERRDLHDKLDAIAARLNAQQS